MNVKHVSLHVACQRLFFSSNIVPQTNAHVGNLSEVVDGTVI